MAVSNGLRLTAMSRSRRTVAAPDAHNVNQFDIMLERQQAMEERAVATQGNAQLFRGRLICLVNLTLELGAFAGKGLCQGLHYLGYQLVSLADGQFRVVDKADLYRIPCGAEILSLVRLEEGR
jgi:hypothetical protein